MSLDCVKAPLARDAYLAYLNSSAWRARRQRKLRDSGWRCEHCDAKRDLHVHHTSYERLGAELDSDLEVLCANCHEDEHVEEMATSPLGIYLRLARVTLEKLPLADIGDLTADLKERCVKYHVAYDGPAIHRAIGLVTGTKILRPQPPVQRDGTPADPIAISPQEAHEFLVRIAVKCERRGGLRGMPSAERSPVGAQAAHEARVRAQVDAIRRLVVTPVRRPLRERLEEIFAA